MAGEEQEQEQEREREREQKFRLRLYCRRRGGMGCLSIPDASRNV